MSVISQTFLLPFKGHRDYVHGTSLFDSVVSVARNRGIASGRVDLAFHRMLRNPLCVIEERAPLRDDAAVARIESECGECIELVINPSTVAGEVSRVPYDEERICEPSVLSAKGIWLAGTDHDSAIEVAVALCKRMHQRLVDDERKWMFARYQGLFPIPGKLEYRLGLQNNFGTKLTRTELRIGGQQWAQLFFC